MFLCDPVSSHARQHAMHVERDTVVYLSNAGRPTVCKRSHDVRFFWHSRGIILVFLAPLPLQNSKGNPSVGTLNTKDGKILQISRKWYENEIGLLLLWNTNKGSVLGSQSIRVGSNDLEWPWKAGRKGLKFSGKSP